MLVLWDVWPPAGSHSCHIRRVTGEVCARLLLCLQKSHLRPHVRVKFRQLTKNLCSCNTIAIPALMGCCVLDHHNINEFGVFTVEARFKSLTLHKWLKAQMCVVFYAIELVSMWARGYEGNWARLLNPQRFMNPMLAWEEARIKESET